MTKIPQAVGDYTILKYESKDVDDIQKIGRFLIVDPTNKAQRVCSLATIVSTNHKEFNVGEKAIVSYRIGWDVDINNPGAKKTNSYFIRKESNGDEIRFCSNMDIFGVIRDDKMIPKKEYVFAEIPTKKSEKVGLLFIPQTAQDQTTDREGYWTKILRVHPDNAPLKDGQTIYCEPNSDITKEIYGNEILFIPTQKVLGYLKDDTFVPL